MNITRMLLIGDPAPSFKAKTTQGETNLLDDYKGKWVIITVKAEEVHAKLYKKEK